MFFFCFFVAVVVVVVVVFVVVVVVLVFFFLFKHCYLCPGWQPGSSPRSCPLYMSLLDTHIIMSQLTLLSPKSLPDRVGGPPVPRHRPHGALGRRRHDGAPRLGVDRI